MVQPGIHQTTGKPYELSEQPTSCASKLPTGDATLNPRILDEIARTLAEQGFK